MRRNPQTVSAGRPPCMADIERVETKLLAFATPITHCREAAMRKLISGALAYQNQARVPLCLIDSLQEGLCESLPGAELMRQLGFQYIYDRPSYALNTETISVEMLERAAGGETVSLDIPDTTCRKGCSALVEICFRSWSTGSEGGILPAQVLRRTASGRLYLIRLLTGNVIS